jgi:hypothetical protein
MKKAFLIYRPEDYDKTAEHYLVCNTLKDAQTAIKIIIEFCEKLKQEMPTVPPNYYSLDWSIAIETRRKMLEKAKWPFGVNLRNEVDTDRAFDRSCLEIKELPVPDLTAYYLVNARSK